MSSGILSGLSGVRRVGLKALGLAVLSAGLVLGGCNNKLKEEHEAAMKENAELRERLASTDSEKNSMQQQVSTLQSENSRLQTEVAQSRTQPAVGGYPDDGVRISGGNGGRSGSNGRNRGSERTIEIAGDVLFGPGSATLKADAKTSLNRYVSQLKNASTVRIEGHTDSDPIRKSKFGSNKALSQARADAVRDYLVTRGVSRGKIETVGKGSSEPKGTKKESRRVDIVVVE